MTSQRNNTFDGDTIWITGASSGIGAGLATAFAARGAAVVLSARDEAALGRVAAACTEAGARPDDVMVAPLDVVDESAMPGAVDAVLERFGKIDLLINNAGLGQRSWVVDTSLEVYRRMFDVNVMGPIALTKAVLPTMIERGSGRIAVTSSLAGKFGVPQRTGYCMAKHAVMGFFDALRGEVAYHGVGVSTIVPGVVMTNVVASALRGDGTPIGADDGVMDDGLTVAEAVELIMAGLAEGDDEIVAARDQERGMLAMKQGDPVGLFRAIEGMAAGLHEGAA